jgi:outer membrane protein TolC
MSRPNVFVVASVSVVLVASPVFATDTITSIEQAVTVALDHHPDIKLAAESLRKTKNTINQVLGPAKSPTLRATATYTRLSGLGAAFGGGGAGAASGTVQNPFPIGLQIQPPGSVPINLSAPTRSRQTGGSNNSGGSGGGNVFGSNINLNQQSVQMSLTQILDVAGTIRLADHIGDTEVAIVEQEIRRTRNSVSLTVRNQWYATLRADSLVHVASANLERSKAQLAVAEAQLRNGVVAAYDVLRAKTQVANDQQQLITAKNQAQIQRTSLALAIGVSPTTEFKMSAPLAPDDIEIPPVPNTPREQLVAAALKNRPEAIAAGLNTIKAVHNTKYQKGGLNGTVAVSLNGNYNPNPALVSNQQSTGSLTLFYQKPILDGGVSRAATDSARADERRAEIQAEQFGRGIETEVIQAHIAVMDAYERIATSAAGLAQAREAFRLAGVRYREGVDTQVAVYDAQAALTQAETNAVNSKYDYFVALAQLDRVTGKQ